MNRLKIEIIKNTFIVGVILLFAAICTYFIYNKFQTNRDVNFSSKSMDIIYHDNGNKITINKVIPMTDSVGLSTNGYSLSIKNNLTIPVKYKVKIIDDAELNIEEDYEKLIPKEDIRISIKEGKNNNKIYNLVELEKGILLDSELKALDSKNITVRVWIKKDSSLPSGSDMKYHGIIQIIEDTSITDNNRR